MSPTTIRLEDLRNEIGRSLGPTAPIALSQKMVTEFAHLTGDFQWVHVDVDRAEREMGGTIVHGYFVLSLLPQISSSLMRLTGVDHGLNYGLERVRFPAPARVGDSFEGRLKILEAVPRGGGFLMRNQITISVAGLSDSSEKPVCIAENLTLVYPGSGDLE